jgi:aryl sulfotransferase
MPKVVAWPIKTTELHTRQLNSARWNAFNFRSDDIIVATYAKSGTTWTQQIVSQLLYRGAEGINVSRLSPWVEQRILPDAAIAALDLQVGRRFVKTHLPVDALVYSPKAKYIYVGRDGRDVAWSFHNHQFNATDELFQRYNAGMPEGTPIWERGSDDPHEFYRRWFDEDSYPLWPFWHYVRSWWAIRGLPNLLVLHYSDMKADLEGSIRKVATFLDIEIDEAKWPGIVEHCSFDYMKRNASEIAPLGGALWKGGGQTFINKGTNGRWRDVLSADEIAAYDLKAAAELGPECSNWLAFGSLRDVPRVT